MATTGIRVNGKTVRPPRISTSTADVVEDPRLSKTTAKKSAQERRGLSLGLHASLAAREAAATTGTRRIGRTITLPSTTTSTVIAAGGPKPSKMLARPLAHHEQKTRRFASG